MRFCAEAHTCALCRLLRSPQFPTQHDSHHDDYVPYPCPAHFLVADVLTGAAATSAAAAVAHRGEAGGDGTAAAPTGPPPPRSDRSRCQQARVRPRQGRGQTRGAQPRRHHRRPRSVARPGHGASSSGGRRCERAAAAAGERETSCHGQRRRRPDRCVARVGGGQGGGG